MEFGRPEDFLNNTNIRLRAIKRSIGYYHFYANQFKNQYKDKINEHTILFIKGFGNEVNFLSCFRDLLFNSRELLDLLLFRLNLITSTMDIQTSRKFIPFTKRLMKDEYDQNNLAIINFLKTNITYIFHIRKIRNEIKVSPSNIKFRLNTNRIESYCTIPIKDDEVGFIQYLDINNKEKALKNKSYTCVFILDEYFPEMLQFWNTCFTIFNDDLNLKS